MSADPPCELKAGIQRVFGQNHPPFGVQGAGIPLEQPASDNLACFRACCDCHRFADAVDATPRVSVNDEAVPLSEEAGFATLVRRWKPGDVVAIDLPMPVRRVRAHHAVAAPVAFGVFNGFLPCPLVYAFEGVDNGGKVVGVALRQDAPLETEFREELFGGVTVVRAGELLAVPYFAWANRGKQPMQVWLRCTPPR